MSINNIKIDMFIYHFDKIIFGDRLVNAEMINLLLDGLVIVIYFVALYKIFTLTKKIYGGRFSNLIPHLSAGTSLLLLNSIFEGMTRPNLIIFQDVAVFQVGLDTIQIIAGLFFLSAFYQLYNIRFITEGFFEKTSKNR